MNKVTKYRGYRDAYVGLPCPVLPFGKEMWALKCRTWPNLNFTEFDTSFRKFNNLTASYAYVYSIGSVSWRTFEA